MEIYINKNLIAVTRTNNENYVAMSNKGSDLFIASRGGTGYVAGKFSNFAVFNTELDQTKVTNLYNNGSPSTDISSLNPTAWYKLNAEDAFVYPNWIIIDSAGSNNGASVGMTSANLVQSNLQLGVGYSPYALELDGTSNYFNCGSGLGNSLGNAVTNFTLSGWYAVPAASANNEGLFGLSDASGNNKFSLVQVNYGTRTVFFNNSTIQRTFNYDSRNQWANFVIVVSGDGSSPLTIKYYHDGTELSLVTFSGTLPNSIDFSGNNAYIGNAYPLTKYFAGDVSNFSFFNFSLTSAQVTELNNNQRTANLNNLSFAKPLSWWELGSNSSFNSGVWTALNEGTSTGGNAVSTANMANDDIINGVGYTSNGLGNSTIEIKGDAPYSSGNALSENMDVLDRVKEVAPFVVGESFQFTAQMAAGESFNLRTRPGGETEFRVDWGQGNGFISYTSYQETNSPPYATAGLFTIKIGETVGGVYKGLNTLVMNSSTSKSNVRELQHWGKSTWTNLSNSFRTVPNLTISATDYPDLSQCTSLFYSFNLSQFPGSNNFTGWDVSNQTTFGNMFSGVNFQGGSIDLSNWDMSSATNIEAMFSGTVGNIGDISSWDVSNVVGTGFKNLSSAATSGFTSDISSWNVSGATNLTNMLRSASFNHNVGAWTLGSGLTTMTYMMYQNGMSTNNYTDSFVGWADSVKINGYPYNVNASNQNGKTYDNARPGGSNFANAAAARTFLTTAVASGSAGWTISSDTIIN